MKVLFTTGGTGGHIYPALALAKQLLRDEPDSEVLFVGNSDRMENTIIPQAGYPFTGIEAARFNDNGNKLKALRLLHRSYRECIKIVEKFDPDIVVGFGGYVTVPVIMAAHYLGVKTVIHEQNSIAGMANKSISHIVDKVVTVYPQANEAFPSKKVFCLGNPRESEVAFVHKDKGVLQQFDIDVNRKTLLIVMGSLGSTSINEKMVDILQGFSAVEYNVIYVTGKNSYEDFTQQVQSSDTIKIVPYIDNFIEVAANCDLVVSRGGATSACEYMALGLPSIIVPSPYVPNNHQFLNAQAMVLAGASVIIEEKDLSRRTLINTVNDIISDDDKLRQMSLAARRLSHPTASEDIVKLMKETARKKKK